MLSKEDQQAFDRLFDRAKFHTAAGVYMANPYPLETIFVSIILEHKKMIGDILGKVKEREGKENLNQNKWKRVRSSFLLTLEISLPIFECCAENNLMPNPAALNNFGAINRWTPLIKLRGIFIGIGNS